MTGRPRILITGSRDWTDSAVIRSALGETWIMLGAFTLVHGDCPTGADRIADVWGRENHDIGVILAPYPADWKTYGRRAGPIRNAAMVGMGADCCFAFIGPCTSMFCERPDPHGSHGASGCADMAEAAGIPTLRRTPEGLV